MSSTLYNNLYNNTENAHELVTDEEKDWLCDNIKRLDQKGHELIYAIVKIYDLKHASNITTGIPMEGKQRKSGGIKFDLDHFPAKLIKMLHLFVDMHLKSLEDEKKRAKTLKSTEKRGGKQAAV